ncbi:hypothetical protein RhiirB3_457030, partial [Rhizophagus irregularis]
MAVKKTTKQVKKTTKRTKRQTVKRERVKQAAKRSRVNLVTKRSQLLRKKPSATKRSTYSIEQKKKVVAYAKQNGKNEAARHFQLNGSIVR